MRWILRRRSGKVFSSPLSETRSELDERAAHAFRRAVPAEVETTAAESVSRGVLFTGNVFDLELHAVQVSSGGESQEGADVPLQ